MEPLTFTEPVTLTQPKTQVNLDFTPLKAAALAAEEARRLLKSCTSSPSSSSPLSLSPPVVRRKSTTPPVRRSVSARAFSPSASPKTSALCSDQSIDRGSTDCLGFGSREGSVPILPTPRRRDLPCEATSQVQLDMQPMSPSRRQPNSGGCVPLSPPPPPSLSEHTGEVAFRRLQDKVTSLEQLLYSNKSDLESRLEVVENDLASLAEVAEKQLRGLRLQVEAQVARNLQPLSFPEEFKELSSRVSALEQIDPVVGRFEGDCSKEIEVLVEKIERLEQEARGDDGWNSKLEEHKVLITGLRSKLESQESLRLEFGERFRQDVDTRHRELRQTLLQALTSLQDFGDRLKAIEAETPQRNFIIEDELENKDELENDRPRLGSFVIEDNSQVDCRSTGLKAVELLSNSIVEDQMREERNLPRRQPFKVPVKSYSSSAEAYREDEANVIEILSPGQMTPEWG
eukprot:TRINITY_DN19452_c0_g1_i3.p1 TRINITY_DN19452_c0_g1~~TRINITY_DN19452_c0_g1_i3.p1  ORF type:complete len:475 (+),score=84.22 TRINITY_DN19452_c0_g1_i3:52-1425(+)